MQSLLKATILSSIVTIVAISAFFLVSFLDEPAIDIGRIKTESALHPCEVLTNQMIQARNSMKEYAINPDQFSAEEAEKISQEYRDQLNGITREFGLKGCDKNLDDWVTPELTQEVIDQTGG